MSKTVESVKMYAKVPFFKPDGEMVKAGTVVTEEDAKRWAVGSQHITTDRDSCEDTTVHVPQVQLQPQVGGLSQDEVAILVKKVEEISKENQEMKSQIANLKGA